MGTKSTDPKSSTGLNLSQSWWKETPTHFTSDHHNSRAGYKTKKLQTVLGRRWPSVPMEPWSPSMIPCQKTRSAKHPGYRGGCGQRPSSVGRMELLSAQSLSRGQPDHTTRTEAAARHDTACMHTVQQTLLIWLIESMLCVLLNTKSSMPETFLPDN